ncbi:PREDICTED: uncharacterized protein LOC106816184 [Priapulus caudatus]|uniref:Uncharacterized protein LOC106816184 n=1 Tax=Priapulus caudatus TaxID=37621 RepID=A0ABM1EVL0_PRICU|nr:PREDICTED: uncharacterized protein LOC106816184 [Priapulus caudatus]
MASLKLTIKNDKFPGRHPDLLGMSYKFYENEFLAPKWIAIMSIELSDHIVAAKTLSYREASSLPIPWLLNLHPCTNSTVENSLVVNVAPGFRTTIGLTYRRVYMKGTPTAPKCESPREQSLKRYLNATSSYNKAGCMHTAHLTRAEKKCKCVMKASETLFDDREECSILTYFTCFLPYLQEFKLSHDTIDPGCPDDCIVDTYEYQMSSHVAPSVRWSKVLNRSLAESRLEVIFSR